MQEESEAEFEEAEVTEEKTEVAKSTAPATKAAAVAEPTPAQPKQAESKPASGTSTAANSAKAPQANATKHVVKQGETLYSISRMYAVTINDLTTWNGLGDEPLKLGQELLIAEPLTTPAAASQQNEYKAPAKTATEYHTVVSGETLYQISKAYNVSLDDLKSWNNLSDNNIKLGQELRVQAPAQATSPVKATEEKTSNTATPASGVSYHTVAPGESMYQISRKYGVTIKDIMEWNNKSDFSVSIGEKLLVKKK